MTLAQRYHDLAEATDVPADHYSPCGWENLAHHCADLARDLEQHAAHALLGQQYRDRAEVMRQRAHRCRRRARGALVGRRVA